MKLIGSSAIQRGCPNDWSLAVSKRIGLRNQAIVLSFIVTTHHSNKETKRTRQESSNVLVQFQYTATLKLDRLCGVVVRVSGWASRGPEFESQLYNILLEVVFLEPGPLSLLRIIEEVLEKLETEV
jgi:hypothetical protein